eukprot:6461397-Amphidinium_carterae.1
MGCTTIVTILAVSLFPSQSSDASQNKATRRYAFWKQQLDDFYRLEAGHEEHKDNLEEIQQSLETNPEDVAALNTALARLPAYIEALRPAVLQGLFATIQSGVEKVLTTASEKMKDVEVMVVDDAFLGDLRSLSQSLKVAVALAMQFPEITNLAQKTVTVASDFLKSSQLAGLVQAIKPFNSLPDDAKYPDSATAAFVTKMSSHSSFHVESPKYRVMCQVAFENLAQHVCTCVSDSKEDEKEQKPLQDLMNAMRTLGATLPVSGEAQGEFELRGALLKAMDTTSQIKIKCDEINKTGLDKLIDGNIDDFVQNIVHFKSLKGRLGGSLELPKAVHDGRGVHTKCKEKLQTVADCATRLEQAHVEVDLGRVGGPSWKMLCLCEHCCLASTLI